MKCRPETQLPILSVAEQAKEAAEQHSDHLHPTIALRPAKRMRTMHCPSFRPE